MTKPRRPAYRYQVGGSLRANDPSYVFREADDTLYELLKAGDFCYVFNCRQMGKSSLGTQVMTRLVGEGVCCVRVDLTTIGTEGLAMPTWYRSLIDALHQDVAVVLEYMAPETATQVDWQAWQAQYQALIEAQDIAPAHLFNRYLQEILLRPFPQQQFVICIDEIDNVLNLKFDSSDFFSLIRACFNRRADDGAYERLTFALFGVATPSRLIQDPNKTPFNLGRGVVLTGFTFEEAGKLAEGLAGLVPDPAAVLREILAWTGGQPFLTQKLCDWVQRGITDLPALVAGEETAWVEQLVRSRLIANWHNEDEPQHFKTIYQAIVPNEKDISELAGLARKRLVRSLQLYQEILQTGAIPADDSEDQIALCLSGLVVREGGQLRSYNRIYEQVFNQDWIAQELAELCPDYYLPAFNRWRASQGKDPDCLLPEQQLLAALQWSADQRLSNEDYQFLAACQDAAKQRLEATLNETKRQTQRQIRIGLGVLVVSIVGALVAGMIALERSGKASQATQQMKKATQEKQQVERQKNLAEAAVRVANKKQQQAETSRKQAEKNAKAVNAKLSTATNNLRQTQQILQTVNQTLAAKNQEVTLTQQQVNQANLELRASDVRLQAANSKKSFLAGQEFQALLEALRANQKLNQLDKSIWPQNNTQMQVVTALHQAVYGVQEKNTIGTELGSVSRTFSPDGKTIIVVYSKKVEIWSLDGRKLKSFPIKARFMGDEPDVEISPDGNIIAIAHLGKIRLWRINGQELTSLQTNQITGSQIDFSPDSKMIVTGDSNGKINLWSLDGHKLESFSTFSNDNNLDIYTGIIDVNFSPNGKMIVSTDQNGIKVWNLSGSELQSFRTTTKHANFTHNGRSIYSYHDSIISIWSLGEEEPKRIQLNKVIRAVQFSPDDKVIASLDTDGMIRLQNSDGQEIKYFLGNSHEFNNNNLNFSPDGRILISLMPDGTTKLWKLDRKNSQSYLENEEVRLIFSSDRDKVLVLKENPVATTFSIHVIDKKITKSIQGYTSKILKAKFSPDGKSFASIDINGQVKIWDLDGKELHSFLTHMREVTDLEFSPNNKLIAISNEHGMIGIWHIDGSFQQNFKGDEYGINSISFNSNGKFLILDGKGKNELRESSKQDVQDYKKPGKEFDKLFFDSKKETMALTDESGKIEVFDSDGNQLGSFQGHQGRIHSLSFSLDKKMIASAGEEGTIKIWNFGGKRLNSFQSRLKTFVRLEFSRDSKMIISIDEDAGIYFWDLNGKLLQFTQEDRQGQYGFRWADVTFSPDGKMVASFDDSGTIKLWSIDGKETYSFPSESFPSEYREVTYLSFTPDGKTIVSGHPNGIQLWNLDLDSLMKLGCDWVRDYLQNNPNALESDRKMCGITRNR